MKNNIIIDILEEEHWDAINVMVRWNGVRRINQESLRDHQYTATLFCDFLLEELFPDKTKHYLVELKLKTLRSILKHDGEEMYTGDMLHNVKYNQHNGESLRKILNDYISHKLKQDFDLNIASHAMFVDSLSCYKDGVIKDICKVCDWLACLQYLKSEKSLGNTNFDKYITKCVKELLSSIAKSKISLNYFHKKDVDLTVYNILIEHLQKIK
jgi:5'-deoxynucleotidase YfbR-like HD superfamily hydrolase